MGSVLSIRLIRWQRGMKVCGFLQPFSSTMCAVCTTSALFFVRRMGYAWRRYVCAGLLRIHRKKPFRRPPWAPRKSSRGNTAGMRSKPPRDCAAADFAIAAIETSPHSVDLFQWQPSFPVCVAFGNEVEGLRPELLEMADTHVRIPMLGKKMSLNVATAAGIVLYELLREYRILRINSKRHASRTVSR